MKYEELPLKITDHRFELEIEGHTAFINYKLHDNVLKFIHTEVPPELGGKGVGPAIAEKALHYAKEQGYKILAYCPFIQAYLKRHPEWEGLLAGE